MPDPTAPAPEWFATRAGSLITTNQTAVGLGAQAWLELLSGRLEHSTWYQFSWTERGAFAIEEHHAPAATCPICRPTPGDPPALRAA